MPLRKKGAALPSASAHSADPAHQSGKRYSCAVCCYKVIPAPPGQAPLGHQRKTGQGPDPQKDLAHDLAFFHRADHTAAAVDGGGPMVAQHKITVFRHLIGELDVAFSQGLSLIHI